MSGRQKVCDCNQGRLPCNCKEPAGWPDGWKMAPPSPPPMRGGKQSTDLGGIILIIIFAVAIGVTCGWQMHGGVCS